MPTHTYTPTEPPTPTSTVTIRRLNASPNSNDDALPPMMSRNTRTRSSSRTYKWIEDQQHLATAVDDIHLDDTPVARHANLPYLAYPQTSAAPLVKPKRDGVARMDSYVFVDPDVSQPQPTERVPKGRDAHVTQVCVAGT